MASKLHHLKPISVFFPCIVWSIFYLRGSKSEPSILGKKNNEFAIDEDQFLIHRSSATPQTSAGLKSVL